LATASHSIKKQAHTVHIKHAYTGVLYHTTTCIII